MKKINIILTLLLSVVMFSCSNTDDMLSSNSGYLTINVSAVTSTNNKGTRAIPAEYNPKQMAIEILNAAGKIVEQTDDASMWDGKAIALRAGEYTVNVHSNNWDGNDSGRDVPFYAGSTTVTITSKEKSEANVVCTLANVKVSVQFDASVAEKFENAYVEVASTLEGILAQTFTLGNEESLKSAYFPVGNLTATLHITNKSGKEYTKETVLDNVQARDHFILKYSVEASGNGEFTVTADDTEQTYTYTFYVPAIPAEDFTTESVTDAWSTSVTLESSITDSKEEIEDDSKVFFELKADDEEAWARIPAEKVSEGSEAKARLIQQKGNVVYRAKVKNLRPGVKYTYRLVYIISEDNVLVGNTANFTTEAQAQLPNSGFEDWYSTGGLKYACSQADYNNLFWGSSNVNAVVTKINGASGTTDCHSGSKAALLESKYANIIGIKKFAAASLFSGGMPRVTGTSGASIDFGRPFTSRPTEMTGYFKYSTANVNRTGSYKMPDGSNIPLTTNDKDMWSCYVALTTEGYTFDNSSQAKLNETIKDFKSGNDPTVIAYGEVADADCVEAGDWTPFSVKLHYYDTTTKPTHIIVVISSSKYGDYFTGCDKSKLYVDDLELVYGELEQ